MNIAFRRYLDGSAFLRAADDGTGSATSVPAAGEPPVAGAVEGAPAEGATIPDADVGASPPGPTPAASETAPAAPGEAAPVAKPTGVEARISGLTAEKWAERRRAEAAENQNAILQQQLRQMQARAPEPDADGNVPAAAAPPAKVTTPSELQAMATQIANEQQFQKDVGSEIESGRKSHTDFDQVAANLQRFGELPRTFVEAAMATGKGAEVIYALGQDAAEADRILSMQSPVQQAVALATLAGGLAKPTPAKLVSSAPAPIVPKVGGHGSNPMTIDDPNIPIADFIKLREKALASKSAASR